MKAMKPNSIDAIVCDPPYGLGFMGKEWDKFKETGQSKFQRQRKDDKKYKNQSMQFQLGAMNYEDKLEMQLWHTQWLTEAYKVLKPGGSMLVMGGTRTSHRLACAIEDSGFIIKDTLMWIYGSGFPKAQDLGKMIDKRGRAILFFDEIRELLKYHLKKSGMSLKEVNQAFDFAITGSGMAGHWFANITQQSLPTKSQWLKLKEILNIPDNKFDDVYREIESDKRPIIGKDKNWGKASDSLGMGDKEWNVTLPYSDLAKHWDGFKVGGIKPAYEPIIWAVKPPEGSYVDNVLKWGVGAVNVAETRIGTEKWLHKAGKISPYGNENIWDTKGNTPDINREGKGRFPANIILSHHPECVQVGVKKVKATRTDNERTDKGGMFLSGGKKTISGQADSNGLETVESWDCHPDCPVRLLDEQSGNIRGFYRPNCRNKQYETNQDINFGGGQVSAQYSDNGGASRFFYCAKASRGERNAGLEGMEEKMVARMATHGGVSNIPSRAMERFGTISRNNHPTVKPIKLFEYLIKLVTREGQIILDPFIGSGTTAIAAHNIGRKCVGIEKEDEYLTIAKRRIDYWQNQPKQMEIRI